MAQYPQTFLEEATSAARGCWALVAGQRNAATYFDFSPRGLVGSFIAVAIAVGLAGFGPMLFGAYAPPGAATQSIIMNVALFIAQAAMAFVVLRQMGRQDGFIPYLVATNWVTLLSALMMLVSVMFGPAGIVLLFAVVVVAMLTFINIGRYVVTLKGMQIALLFISQAVGVFLAMGVLVLILPMPALPPV